MMLFRVHFFWCLPRADFKKAMDQQCSSAYDSIDMALYNIYEVTNKPVEEKLQELFAVLERIGKNHQF